MAIENPKCCNCGANLGGEIILVQAEPARKEIISAVRIHSEEALAADGLFCNTICATWFLVAQIVLGTTPRKKKEDKC